MDELFVLTIALILTLLLRWGFKTLPEEKWQVLATVPRSKDPINVWNGTNFTYYGLFNALACVMAVITVFFLLGASRVPVGITFMLTACLLCICIPSSRLMARIVEKKKYTASIGGASFVGVVSLPVVVWLCSRLLADRLNIELHTTAVLAAIFTAYAIGEGIGRLACISFGCCYGKPLTQVPSVVGRLFAKHGFIFRGNTKKIAYSHDLEGVRVVPIQAVTAILYCAAGVIGIYLFLKGFYRTAFLETLLITQLWRFVSEFFRADYRGEGKFSAYQIMGIMAVLYAIAVIFLSPHTASLIKPEVSSGLSSLWNPALILFIQALGIGVFLYTGRSSVTGATLQFYVHHDRI